MSALLLIQLAAFYILKQHNQAIIETTISSDLTTGAQVFKRLLEVRHRQLTQSAEILVTDYGFRQTIATNDQTTIASSLSNHGERAEASLLLLSNLNHQIIASSPENIAEAILASDKISIINDAANDDASHFVSLLLPNTESTNHTDTQTMSEENMAQAATPQPKNAFLFQLVSASVSAPLAIATLTIGHEIDDALVTDLKALTDMELLFFANESKDWRLHASSLSRDAAMLFKPTNMDIDDHQIYAVEGNNMHYLAMPIVLSKTPGNEVIAIAAKPMEKLMAPFAEVERMFIYLLILTVLLSVIAIYIVTHRMVRPLNNLAHIDNLTSLGNRRLFNTILDNALLSLRTRNKPFALLMMDLNKFKQINDTLGHNAGDIVLQEAAKRLKDVMRNADNIVRLGGDEFAVIVYEGSRAALTLIAEKISAAIAKPIQLGENYVTVGTSIGIVIAPLDSSQKSELMKFADDAMYICKTKQLHYHFYGDYKFKP